MRTAWLMVLPAVLLAGSTATVGATTEVGAMGILYDVHGYNAGGRVLVPLRATAEWLGALVDYEHPTIIVEYGPTLLKLTVGSRTAYVDGRTKTLDVPAKVYGGVTCVPLRFVAESLNIGLSYHSRSSDEGVRVGVMPVIVVQSAWGTNRIIVHGEPPNRVQQIIRDLNWNASDLMWGHWGEYFTLSVQEIRGGYANVFGPSFYSEGYGFSPTELSDRPILYADGRWWFPAGY